jgi:hypothetical protein
MRRIAFLAPALLVGCATVHQPDHRGLHFTGDIGIGGSSSSASEGGVDARYSGPGGVYALAVGGAVIVPNLIVGGQLWGSSVSDVRFTLDGQSETLHDVTYSVYGLGALVKYYVEPANVYVAATPSVAQLSLQNDAGSDETEWGPALRLAVGKEWYASQHWGLGVAGVLHLASNRHEGSGPAWRTVGGGVVFSASFD